ncbi:hypothetical protein LR032_03815 [Candidatus Bipolaricaulota bacterium]|nr:hypothetical protein [Candidatus Bipolaricaulota bacterium]
MVKLRRTLLILLLPTVFLHIVAACPAHAADPRVLGRGTAYTAVARGPLATLWNPAGATATPGVHGAIAAGLSPAGSSLLFGVSIAAVGSPTVTWSTAQDGDERKMLGTFAFSILPRTAVGGGISYRSSDRPGGISFQLGLLHSEPQWAIGASLAHLGAGIFGAEIPLSFRVGGALDATPGVTLTLDLHSVTGRWKVAVGGAAQVWVVDIRWGTAILLVGGIDRLGFGIGFDLFGLRIDLALGACGGDLRPYGSLGIEVAIPAWW